MNEWLTSALITNEDEILGSLLFLSEGCNLSDFSNFNRKCGGGRKEDILFYTENITNTKALVTNL